MTDALEALAYASRLATQADSALAGGDIDGARNLYATAARRSEDAVVQAKESAQLRGLLMNNAAALWIKAGELDHAQAAIHGFMADDPPGPVRASLRNYLMSCWQQQTASSGGDEYFTPLELGLRGGDVGFGAAPTEEVTKRQDIVQTMLWRAAEYEVKLPYRPRGAPSPNVRAAATLFCVTPAPGSYRIPFRIRTRWQKQALFPEEVDPVTLVPGGEALVHRAIALVQAICDGPDRAAREIDDPLYRMGFSRLVRELAPDGKRVELVDMVGGTARRGVDLTPRARVTSSETIKATIQDAGMMSLVGELSGMELKPRMLRLTLTLDNGTKQAVVAHRGEGFEERVGPLWSHRVSLIVRSDGGKSWLQDIEGLDASDAP